MGGATPTAVFGSQPPFQSIPHLVPFTLFVGLSAVTIGVSLLALAVRREGLAPDSPEARPPTQAQAPVSAKRERRGLSMPDPWYGRPVPNIARGIRRVTRSPASPSAMQRRPEEATKEISIPLLPSSERGETPSSGKKDRLLRSPVEGTFPVFSLDGALRDLEVVDQIVHERRAGRGELRPETLGTLSNRAGRPRSTGCRGRSLCVLGPSAGDVP
jgi:hypothetical protein